MKNKWRNSPFFRIVLFLPIFIALIIVTAVILFYYIFSIPEPEGLSLASWPDMFTDNFSLWMSRENGNIQVEKIGLERLEKYGLWLQVIDENGQEVFAYNKPETIPVNYSSSELLDVSASPYEDGYTIFSGSFADSENTWPYFVGFPYSVGKHMLYYNGERVSRLSPVVRTVILFCFAAFLLFVFGYGIWLLRKLSGITEGIKEVSQRSYRPMKESGLFRDVYAALNKMDQEVQNSDKLQADTDKVRNDWISNITHDLKTPLSPIKGYAELLADHPETRIENIQEYGSIILKNICHVERLVNDLKLTYQLDSGAVPYHPQKVRFIRYMRELIIDILNDPVFEKRGIVFESDMPELTVQLDADLFRRAVQNIVINALVHNPADTRVEISVQAVQDQTVSVHVRDNGEGMDEAAQSDLFNRYYRGTNTKEKTEGSGLGLAIAKQIIMVHGGEITVKSRLGEGTEFMILLPLKEEFTPV